jgi:hypothetical protein
VEKTICREQGGFVEEAAGSVCDTSPWITVRKEAAVVANNNLAVADWPDATVNGVEEPMVAPAALTNEMLPVQDAAVPDVAFAAVFTTTISAVSELPKLAKGNLNT